MRFIVLILFFPLGLASQVGISFNAHYQDGAVLLDSQIIEADDTLSITKCRFYAGKFKFILNEEEVFAEPTKYRLIDIERTESMWFQLDCPKEIEFDKIQFEVGVDSLTNVSGAMGGDLDPVKGMYWAWNSGYINFKLEGTSCQSSARKNEFAYHLGGYSFPYKSVQIVSLEARTNNIDIYLNLKELIEAVNIKLNSHVMSPSEESQRLSELLPSLFSVD